MYIPIQYRIYTCICILFEYALFDRHIIDKGYADRSEYNIIYGEHVECCVEKKIIIMLIIYTWVTWG